MPDKRGVFAGDDERAAVGREHRERARSHPGAVPILEIDEATPEPIPAEDSGDEITAPSERVLADDIAREIWQHVDRAVARANDRIMETAGGTTSSSTLHARIDSLEKQLRWWRGAVLAALLAAAGSLVAVGKGLYERGEREGGDAIRLQTLERDVQQNRLDIRDVREDARRHDNRGGWFTPTPASKGTPQ